MQNAVQHVLSAFQYILTRGVAAVSLLYDIAIFTYSVQNKEWHVFNESAMYFVA